MQQISWFEITIKTNSNFEKQQILLDDLRIQDGLQKEKNATGGYWYPPNNRPQYGLYDIDPLNKFYDPDNLVLKLLNVRQSQYTTNGDHGRMIFRYGTPDNFSMRLRFQVTDLPKNKKDLSNTWFRVMYDFDPDYDPGHDWFGTFFSMQWNKFGLLTVIPVERQYLQDQEPANKDIDLLSANKFSLRENVLYELRLVVHGQQADATIYEVKNSGLEKKSTSSYGFKRQRYGIEKRYPIALEVTGNIKAIIHEIEISEL